MSRQELVRLRAAAVVLSPDELQLVIGGAGDGDRSLSFPVTTLGTTRIDLLGEVWLAGILAPGAVTMDLPGGACATGAGVWLGRLAPTQPAMPVFRDASGEVVRPLLPDGAVVSEIAVQSPCPACGESDWELVSAPDGRRQATCGRCGLVVKSWVEWTPSGEDPGDDVEDWSEPAGEHQLQIDDPPSPEAIAWLVASDSEDEASELAELQVVADRALVPVLVPAGMRFALHGWDEDERGVVSLDVGAEVPDEPSLIVRSERVTGGMPAGRDLERQLLQRLRWRCELIDHEPDDHASAEQQLRWGLRDLERDRRFAAAAPPRAQRPLRVDDGSVQFELIQAEGAWVVIGQVRDAVVTIEGSGGQPGAIELMSLPGTGAPSNPSR